ncbi:MAG: Gfo/Idh/MocA family oxidoreductase [Roseiarcus sp.]
MADAQRELKVALVGTGFMGRVHSIAYAILPSFYPDLPPVRRRVVVDITEGLARKGAHQFGYDEWAVDWRSVIKRPDIDIVDIVTPNDSHRPIAEFALDHGKHVLCEKPLAVTVEDARVMAEKAGRVKTVSMLVFNYRRCSAVLEAKRLIDEGKIGKILSFRGLYLQDWAMPEGTPWSWRFGAAQSGSGALGDIGSHALDIAHYLVGEIDSVAAAAETFVKARPRPGETSSTPRPEMAAVDVDDCTIALLRFSNGALGTLEASRFAYGRKNFLSFEISGSKGALAFNWERSNELQFFSAEDRADVQGFRAILTGPAQPNGELFWPIPGIGTAYIETQVAQVGEFVRAISGGSENHFGFAHGYRIQQVMEGILAASRTGRWVSVAPAS